jgi:hypothetical protein
MLNAALIAIDKTAILVSTSGKGCHTNQYTRQK